MTPALPIDKIQIGTRHRREMGDIASLAASIKELGLSVLVQGSPATKRGCHCLRADHRSAR
jgi:hypothetical protein